MTERLKNHICQTADLYSTIKQNPFKVFSIPIEKAKQINEYAWKRKFQKRRKMRSDFKNNY